MAKNLVWKLTICLLISAFVVSAKAQQFTPITLDSSAVVYADALGNIYVQQKSALRRYNSNGKFEFLYEDLSQGIIASVDVTDPLKILVYYKDYNNVVFLDKTLSPLNQISLLSTQWLNVQAVAHSRDDKIWAFDAGLQQLLLIDETGKKYEESANVVTEIGLVFTPNQILEYDNYVYLVDKEKGIYIFDRFATFVKQLPIKASNNIQVVGSKILFWDTNGFNYYDTETLELGLIETPKHTDFCILVNKHLVYVNGGVVYKQ